MNVTIQNACKAYEGRAILDQFDLEFPQKGKLYCRFGDVGFWRCFGDRGS